MSAAAFASASRVFGSLDHAGLKAYGTDLAKRARAAWDWALAHPSVLYWNNDESRQPGSGGLASGQQELNEKDRALAWFEAAVNLHEATGDPQLRELAESRFAALVPQYGPTLWEVDAQDAVLQLSRAGGLSPGLAQRIQAAFLGHVAPQTARFAVDVRKTDPYRAPLKDYTWASNKAKAMQGRLFQLVAMHTPSEAAQQAARAAALDYLHYIHGVNPLGLVYLTNMGADGATHSANTMFHTWFAKGTRWEKSSNGKPGPPPGFLVGGPNPGFKVDACCSGPRSFGLYLCHGEAASNICERRYRPPMGQPPAKSYLQFNDGWPANSWEVTEPSTGYQAYYIQLLAAAVR
jgi:hypothetical protein